MAARCQHCVSRSKRVMGRPRPRPRHEFPPSKAKAQQTCYTATMNLTHCPPTIPITPTMSTCSEKKPAQSPPAAPPTVCAAATGKKSARVSHRARPALCDRCRQKRDDDAKPAPPAAQKKTCAANAHLDLPSKNQSHRLCRPLCRNTKTRPFPENCALISRKPRQNVTLPILSRQVTSISCHGAENSSQISTPFDHLCGHPIPFRYPSCLPHNRLRSTQPQAGRANRGPNRSRPRPAPPRHRRGARLHHQRPYRALICSTVPLGRRSDFGAGPARLARAWLDPSHHNERAQKSSLRGCLPDYCTIVV